MKNVVFLSFFVGIMVQDIAGCARGPEFNSLAGQVAHSHQRLATSATFLCRLGAFATEVWTPALVRASP